MRSRDLNLIDVEEKLTELTSPEELHDFLEGEDRISIHAAAGKQLLKMRGVVMCEDVLKTLRAEGYKV